MVIQDPRIADKYTVNKSIHAGLAYNMKANRQLSIIDNQGPSNAGKTEKSIA